MLLSSNQSDPEEMSKWKVYSDLHPLFRDKEKVEMFLEQNSSKESCLDNFWVSAPASSSLKA